MKTSNYPSLMGCIGHVLNTSCWLQPREPPDLQIYGFYYDRSGKTAPPKQIENIVTLLSSWPWSVCFAPFCSLLDLAKHGCKKKVYNLHLQWHNELLRLIDANDADTWGNSSTNGAGTDQIAVIGTLKSIELTNGGDGIPCICQMYVAVWRC